MWTPTAFLPLRWICFISPPPPLPPSLPLMCGLTYLVWAPPIIPLCWLDKRVKGWQVNLTVVPSDMSTHVAMVPNTLYGVCVCFVFFRVLRQIIQCFKPIFDVLLLLFYLMAFCALSGMTTIDCGAVPVTMVLTFQPSTSLGLWTKMWVLGCVWGGVYRWLFEWVWSSSSFPAMGSRLWVCSFSELPQSECI